MTVVPGIIKLVAEIVVPMWFQVSPCANYLRAMILGTTEDPLGTVTLPVFSDPVVMFI